MKLVVIEGGIGSGKSTILEPLRMRLEECTNEVWQILVEPVDTDPEFHRLLKVFIDNPNDSNKRAEFQNYMTETRANLLVDIPDGNYIIERSLFSDLVFTHTNMLSASAPTGEYWNAYWNVAGRLKDYPKPDVVVYLNRDPHDCLQSCMKRDRAGEDQYDINYFEDLHRFHLAILPQATRMYNVPFVDFEVEQGYYADPITLSNVILSELK